MSVNNNTDRFKNEIVYEKNKGVIQYHMKEAIKDTKSTHENFKDITRTQYDDLADIGLYFNFQQ